MMAEPFAFMDIGDVNLHHRPLKRIQRIKDRNRRVAECTGVDDDPIGNPPGLLDPINQHTFMIALTGINLKTEV